MNIKALSDSIGKVVKVKVERGTWVIPMRIIDVKEAYGHVRYLVAPLDDNASGDAWVNSERVIGNPYEKTL